MLLPALILAAFKSFLALKYKQNISEAQTGLFCINTSSKDGQGIKACARYDNHLEIYNTWSWNKQHLDCVKMTDRYV